MAKPRTSWTNRIFRSRSRSHETEEQQHPPSRVEPPFMVTTSVSNAHSDVTPADGSASDHKTIAKPAASQRVATAGFGLFQLASTIPDSLDNISTILGKNSNVDIIAIHGLRGHFEKTWTLQHKDSDVETLWLRDFLPEQLRQSGVNARILSYGYNSYTVISTSTTNIDTEAEMLISQIDDRRTSAEEAKRPIIFIAHSLGGLLVKKAMITAHARSSIYGNLIKSIKGLVFLGVPHNGANLVQLESFAAKIAKIFSFAFVGNAAFPDALKKNSEIWRSISKDFVDRAAPPLQIRSFVETDRIANTTAVDDHSSRLNLPNEKVSGLAGSDHQTICKFSSPDDQRYYPVWNAICQMAQIDGSQPVSELGILSSPSDKDCKAPILSQEEQNCLQTLYHSDYNEHRARSPEPVLGTCSWIWQHRDFIHWKNDDALNLLWISADPGSGKSALARFLTESRATILPQDKDNLCFFFFKDDSDQQNSAVLAIRAILHQLFTRQKRLLQYAMPHFKAKGAVFTEEIYTLWDILLESTKDEGARDTICIIDALDECEPSTQNQFISILAKFCKLSDTNLEQRRLKFVVTSRPYVTIEHKIQCPLTIRLKIEDESDLIDGDVRLVVEKKIADFDNLKSIPQDLKDKLIARIIDVSGRTFLWASLVLDDLERSISLSRRSLTNLIDRIPASLDAMYEKLLNSTEDRDSARKILHIIVGARRPLTLVEMNIAFAIKSTDRCHDDLDLQPAAHIATLVRNHCGLFVKVDQGKISLIHQTAKEFLTGSDRISATDSEHWKHSFHPTNSDLILSNICITYLGFADFEQASFVLDTDTMWGELEPQLPARIDASFGFLDYAARCWPWHFRQAQDEVDPSLIPTILRLYDSTTTYKKLWLCLCSTRLRDVFKLPFSIAARLGHGKSIEWLSQRGPITKIDMDARDNFGYNMLHYAVRSGDERTLTFLIEKGANIEAVDAWGNTPLHQAVSMDISALVESLLLHGADVKAITVLRETPLHFAHGESVIQLLLEKGADVHARNDFGETPIFRTASLGDEAGVRLLIENGADINATNNIGSTPLFYSTDKRNCIAVVKLLLEKGAEVMARNDYGDTSLHAASRTRDSTIMPIGLKIHHKQVETSAELLIDRGADIMARNDKGKTPLHYAAKGGEEAIVKLLLAKGADAMAKDNTGKTPLHCAMLEIEGGLAARIVAMLIEMGLDVTATDNRGCTPLHYGMKVPYNSTAVGLLMEQGADVNARNHDGEAPLHNLIFCEDEHMCELLVKHGADINAQANDRETALHRVMSQYPGPHILPKTLVLVKTLVDQGARLDIKGEYGKTPFYRAVSNRTVDSGVLEYLISVGADVDVARDNGTTPLHEALFLGDAKKAMLLIEGGADISMKNSYGQSSLYCATKANEKYHQGKPWYMPDMSEVIKLLKERGVTE